MLKWIYSHLPFKQSAFKLIRSLTDLPDNVCQHLHFKGIISVPIDSKHSFRVRHYGYQVENDLFWRGYGNGWEATSVRLWARLARNARTVFDIGANTGVYALAAKAVKPSVRIFAFEPVERIADRLKENVALNGYDIEVVVAGASDVTGEAVIHEPLTAHAYSASLNPDMLANYADIVETKILVNRIDDFIRENKLDSADLFKIDVEKYEFEVLTGFGDAIDKYRPAILIEILQRELGEKLEAFFEGLDYVFYEIVEGEHIKKVEILGAAERNYLICPRQFAADNEIGDIILHDNI